MTDDVPQQAAASSANQQQQEEDNTYRQITVGVSELKWHDNSVSSSKYTLWSFLPKALGEQFRRKGNVVFLLMGLLMFIGANTNLFDTAATPWTLLIPLFVVLTISLLQEAYADFLRHRSDVEMNNHSCFTLQSSHTTTTTATPTDDENNDNRNTTPSISLDWKEVPRKQIYAGDLVLVKNREMVPADIVLLASSNENGTAYIETSSIDGETNLKLRISPSTYLYDNTSSNTFTMEQVISQLATLTALGNPTGIPAVENESPSSHSLEQQRSMRELQELGRSGLFRSFRRSANIQPTDAGETTHFVTRLVSETPNASVNTFTGKIIKPNDQEIPTTVPLDADNLLLRGAMLRNTEWIVGVACFTGKDTKVVKNSFDTPSKFSQLDQQMNSMIDLILWFLLVSALVLATFATISHKIMFKSLWYAGYSTKQHPWPYLPDLPAPQWDDHYPNFIQFALTFTTLLPNLVPLALYVTVELVTRFMMYLVSVDKNMYHEKTDTNAQARNMNVTDLGQVKYVFSDKTGTLTQNRMHFQRCSVDGKIYGAPVLMTKKNEPETTEHTSGLSFFPLAQIFRNNTDENNNTTTTSSKPILSFDAEMFLRTMSICHTVMVEQDFDQKKSDNTAEQFDESSKSSMSLSRLKCKKKTSRSSSLETSPEDEAPAAPSSSDGPSLSPEISSIKSKDGSPYGHVYQAESPDEGALVSAASLKYDFQLVGRDSNGIQLLCSSPSILQSEEIVERLKSGLLTPNILAQSTATSDDSDSDELNAVDGRLSSGLGMDFSLPSMPPQSEPRHETWKILAVNKFDSARKRMSILVRSPPELGSVPILFCKGADSSMLLPSICEGSEFLVQPSTTRESTSLNDIPASVITNLEIGSQENFGSERDVMLNLQSHLGDFATEGLRTLVLAMRILTEEECSNWLRQYHEAATSIDRRDEKLKEAASAVECNLHIVGATAIEDKLQAGVPETIHRIEQAGIKLWVLTGDKMETAIEIGYSTRVLSPEMHLTAIPNEAKESVKCQLAMEFVYLLRAGKLPDYENLLSKINGGQEGYSGRLKYRWEQILATLERFKNGIRTTFLSVYYTYVKTLCGLIRYDENELRAKLDRLQGGQEKIIRKQNRHVRRKNVRDYAFMLWNDFRKTPEGEAYISRHRHSILTLKSNPVEEDFDDSGSVLPMNDVETTSVSSGSLPSVFERAIEANRILDKEQGNSRKVTLLEKLFAVDKDARQGKLMKHMVTSSVDVTSESPGKVHRSSRSLVIEGGALLHILGDDFMEEIFFAIASTCDAVIACRVSPKQKALLVRLVRNYVEPTPVTLAIGDGANDVGMIQEAHIGVGISGLEGKQAVNASDFSIAQFRFLESLLFVHGKWNISRMSTVVLFSFYKNAIFSVLLMIYGYDNLYSGNPLMDPWVGSMFNFITFWPIFLLGCFDRDLEKDYIRRKPEVYAPGPNNELMTKRICLRWALFVFIHAFMIYFIAGQSIIGGGAMTSAFKGLMSHTNPDRPGDGTGSDLKVFGTTIFTVLIFLLAFKVLLESRTIINGLCPPCTCRKGKGEGFWSRLPYTWIGVFVLSLLFHFFCMYTYSWVATFKISPFHPFAYIAPHVYNKRSITWMVVFIVPIACLVVDSAFKLFSNMFFPTQIQIHREISALGEQKSKLSPRQQVVPSDKEGEDNDLQKPLLSPEEQVV